MTRGGIGFYIVLTTFALQSCNTLHNSTSINLEIVEPAKVIFPADVEQLAIRYNNSNVSYNPRFARYLSAENVKMDETNKDSIASWIYYNSFKKQFTNSILFDNIIEISPANYSGVKFDVSKLNIKDSINPEDQVVTQMAATILKQLHSDYTTQPENAVREIKINPKTGIYRKSDLKAIKDSTGADLLLSLDYFSVYEKMNYRTQVYKYMNAFVLSMWNFYNLNDHKLQYFYHRIDTISWNQSYTERAILPDRNDAMMNASSISGENFSNFLAPHWIAVKRTFYQSNNVDFKKAVKLASENKWLEAAEIWRKNVDNNNKNIAAKSMYNLAIACEIQGKIDVALDWVVKSYQVFEEKNLVHAFNCKDYIKILGQRKLDFKKIDMQFNPNASNP